MKLFIAEKPSVAKAIAAELGVSGRGDGFINCRNDVVVTWCFGHLLEQAEPDAYLPDDIPKTKKGRKIWRMQDLPIFPQHWLMEAKTERGAKKQLSVIGKLLKSAATVVNAGDPDREGQLLVDEVLEHFRARQPVERFWVSAVDPASIRKGLAKLGDNRSYAGMRDAARGRSRADWLLGMNLSRAYTLAGGDGLLAVGRVQTPTLFMVARRDYVVRNFTPVPYLSITADLAKETVPFTARWKPGPDQKGLDEEGRLLIDLDVGRALVERLSKEKTATVLSAETKRRKANPPKAYSLADIQIEASKRFGMTAENTLKVCQSLYEVRKITSYPRTDCGYLPESQHADAPAVLAAVARNFPAAAPACAKADPKLKSPTFNDKKVTAHHGIVPVANTIDPATLTREEADIYRLIVKGATSRSSSRCTSSTQPRSCSASAARPSPPRAASCASKAGASSSRRTAGLPRKSAGRTRRPQAAEIRTARTRTTPRRSPHSKRATSATCAPSRDARTRRSRRSSSPRARSSPPWRTSGAASTTRRDRPCSRRRAASARRPPARPSSPNSGARNTSRPKASTCTAPNRAAGSSSGFRPASARPP